MHYLLREFKAGKTVLNILQLLLFLIYFLKIILCYQILSPLKLESL